MSMYASTQITGASLRIFSPVTGFPLAVLILIASLSMPTTGRALDCKRDPLLTRAATQIAKNATPAPSADGLLALVRRLGSDVAPVFAKVGTKGDVAGFDSWFARIGAKADGPLVCGLKTQADTKVVVLGVRAGWLRLSDKGGRTGSGLPKGSALLIWSRGWATRVKTSLLCRALEGGGSSQCGFLAMRSWSSLWQVVREGLGLWQSYGFLTPKNIGRSKQ